MISLEELIKVVESSESLPEAAEKIGRTRQSIYERLSKNGLKIVRESKLKVVKK